MDLSHIKLQIEHAELKVKYLQTQHTLLEYMIGEEMFGLSELRKQHAELTIAPTTPNAVAPVVPPRPEDDD